MKVLLSWSGKQSQAVAAYLRTWLTQLVPGCEPWMSSEDLVPGGKWFTDLMQQLQEVHYCIICLTPENVRSTWLYFEAGAIAAKSRDSHVCGYLIGLSPSALSGPLSQYQSAEATEEGTWALVRSINRKLATPHDETLLKTSFSRHWPRLRKTLQSVLITFDPTTLSSKDEVESEKATYKLTEQAQTILIEASKDKHGMVLMASTMQGLTVETNHKVLSKEGDPRSESLWKAAVRELVRLDLLEGKGLKGEIFDLTAEGYRLADELIAKSGASNA